jgi:ferritin
MYIETLTNIINKALANEISSAMVYHKIAEEVKGTDMEDFSEQLSANGTEEFGHYKEILAYAFSHDISVVLNINPSILATPCTNIIDLDVSNNVTLEQQAYDDYRAAALLARENEDIETENFFIELMNDERRHLDSVAKLSKIQPAKTLSFKQFLSLD